MIRRAGSKDTERVMELLLQVGMVHHEIRPDLFKGNATKYTREELAQIFQNEKTPVFVETDEEDVVRGYAFCVFKQEIGSNVLTDIKTLYIDDLCVEESCRGEHVGKRLYEHVLAFARENGCYNVTLNVWAGNDNAIHFYEKRGLKPQKYGMEVIL